MEWKERYIKPHTTVQAVCCGHFCEMTVHPPLIVAYCEICGKEEEYEMPPNTKAAAKFSFDGRGIAFTDCLDGFKAIVNDLNDYSSARIIILDRDSGN